MLIFVHSLVLTDTRKDPSTKLEFKQRVSIALGAAKGIINPRHKFDECSRLDKNSIEPTKFSLIFLLPADVANELLSVIVFFN